MADPDLVLVELFTSQGCSSCPPADKLIGDLAGRDDVLALGMHVDYWDYLGWKDTFGLAAATARQKAYRDAWGARYVYTPQMVVNGHVEVRGARGDALDAAIAEAKADASATWVEITAEGATLRCRIGGAPEGSEVWLVRYTLRETVAIGHGENAGREITYHNIVDSLEKLGPATAMDEDTIVLPEPGPGTGIAMWVQEPNGGRVLAVARHTPTS
ncbi:MAG: DUF1223 domain-containing protein [Thermohalobaculum sp.]|nr:DUF1223 domain-containing protein [Thermohalobaculum sp.]